MVSQSCFSFVFNWFLLPQVAPKKPSHVKKAVAKKAKKPDSSDESSSSNGEDNSKVCSVQGSICVILVQS